MRVLEDLKVGEFIKGQVEIFDLLPERAKEILFASYHEFAMKNDAELQKIMVRGMGDYTACKSPIEKILYSSLDMVYALRMDEFPLLLDVTPQCEIKDGENVYYADFCINCIDTEIRETVHEIVIECDGHEFHQKTKEQVRYDNERETRMKILGYDVLRFSGSQIFNNPIKCANDILDFALTRIKR
jgi:hypothetical protein